MNHLEKLSTAMQDETAVTDESLKKWRKNVDDTEKVKVPGTDILDYFSSDTTQKVLKEIKINDVEEYIQYRESEGTMTQLELEIRDRLLDLKSPDQTRRIWADRQIKNFMIYINKRNAIVQQSRKELADFNFKQKEVAPRLTNIYNFTTDFIGKTAEGFSNSDTKDKAIMLGAMFIGVIALKKTLGKMFGKKEGDKEDGWMKEFVKYAAGGAGIYLGYEAINKAYSKATNRTIVGGTVDAMVESFGGNPQRTAEIDQVVEQLRTSNFPSEVLEDYSTKSKRKYAFSIANIGTMTVGEFADLYESNFDSKRIEKKNPYPRKPFAEDHLTESERFKIVEDIGKTLNLINPSTLKLVDPKILDEKRDQSIIHVSLDSFKK